MKTLEQTYWMDASAEEVYRAFFDPELIEKWSGAPAIMEAVAGGSWELWGGSIIGKNLILEPQKKIVQEWKEANWEKYSKVTFTLAEVDGKTRVDLLHEDIPEGSYASITDGWKTYYLGPMQEMFTNAS